MQDYGDPLRATGWPERLRMALGEASGALGDLGTLLPLMLGAMAVGGLAPGPVLMGFGAFYLATAAVYRLPVPVQPMKAMGAVLLTGAVSPEALAAAGVMTGAVLLLLGLTGAIDRLARLVPQSVLSGLQLGLGLALGWVALGLMAGTPWLAALVLAVAGMAFVSARVPAALLAVAVAVLAGQAAGLGRETLGPVAPLALPGLPTLADLETAAAQLALPQLALTLTNAVLITALVAGDCYGARAAHVTPRRLSVTSGLANLVLSPFGALPMCHGAGGLVAHHRFGARTWAAPAILGAGLLALALVPGEAARLLGAIPEAALGALLMVAAVQLAASRRLVDARPSCWPVIAVTALVTVSQDPFLGLLGGSLAELARVALVRHIFRGRASGRP